MMRVIFLCTILFFLLQKTFAAEGLYFDLGAGHMQPLSTPIRSELISKLDQMKLTLTSEMSAQTQLTNDIENEIKAAQNQRRPTQFIFSAVGGGMGALSALLLIYSSVPQSDLATKTTLLLGSGIPFTLLGGIVGYIIPSFRFQRTTPVRTSAYRSLRQKELISAAEDLKDAAASMALPVELWSLRRLQDFTQVLMGFEILVWLADAEIRSLTTEESVILARLNRSKLRTPDVELLSLSNDRILKSRAETIRNIRRQQLAAVDQTLQGLQQETPITLRISNQELATETQCLDAISRMGIPQTAVPTKPSL